ncbi:MAG: MBL fold metallo-hydrolase [Pyrinomonadaceae bacterium]
MEFGDYRIEIISDTEFGLDGGAMFGVVPRVLWEKVAPPDERNRIRMNMNCLFVETASERIIIETGIGDKWLPKLADIYAIRRQHSLPESVHRITGYGPEQITIVVNTHLHFDHAGGNTTLNAAGEVVPAFPHARYYIARDEYEHAESPTERDQASYMPEHWRALKQTDQIVLQPADYEVVAGLHMETVPGHSRTMQCVRLVQGKRTLFGFADIAPTRNHVSYPWIMGYDLYPVETLEAKKRLLPQAARENWLCLFYHDADAALFSLVEKDGTLCAVPVDHDHITSNR